MGWAARAKQGKPNPHPESRPGTYLVQDGAVTAEGEKRYALADGGRVVHGVARYYRKIVRRQAPHDARALLGTGLAERRTITENEARKHYATPRPDPTR